MHVIARKALRTFWERHGNAESPLEAWFHEAKAATWNTPAEVRHRYPSASIIGSDRVVFDIGGNKFRLVVRINYSSKTIFIRFVGTHAEYDAIDVETI
jgi:mRNA interferase HigB